MEKRGSYVPPVYVPLHQSEEEVDSEDNSPVAGVHPSQSHNIGRDPTQWSSGICACFDDMQSCCIGALCPCFLFGKNAEFLESGTLAGTCVTHFLLCGIVNCFCCLFTGGLLLGLPGSFVACYSYEYRRTLRAKYNLQAAPCGDFTTHLCCHLCAICQEYREIRERSKGPEVVVGLPVVTAPPRQSMEPAAPK